MLEAALAYRRNGYSALTVQACSKAPLTLPNSRPSWRGWSRRAGGRVNSTESISKSMPTGFWNAHSKRSRRSEFPG